MDNQVTNQQPEISFNTPVAVEPVVSIAQQDIALAPAETSAVPAENPAPQEAIPAPTYYVYPASINVIETNNTSDMLKFEIVFNVSTYNDTDSKSSTVKKMFEVSKSALANEMIADISSAKVNVVEELLTEGWIEIRSDGKFSLFKNFISKNDYEFYINEYDAQDNLVKDTFLSTDLDKAIKKYKEKANIKDTKRSKKGKMNEAANKVSKRMRELAGIAGKGTYV